MNYLTLNAFFSKAFIFLGILLGTTYIKPQILKVPDTSDASESINLQDWAPRTGKRFIDLITEQLKTSPAFILARVETIGGKSGKTYITYFNAPTIHRWVLKRVEDFDQGIDGLYPSDQQIEQIAKSSRMLNKNPVTKRPIHTITYYSITNPAGPLQKLSGSWKDLIDSSATNDNKKSLRALLETNYRSGLTKNTETEPLEEEQQSPAAAAAVGVAQ